MKYFEDLEIGTITRSPRSYEVTREEVIEFAGKYDPQPFHLDPLVHQLSWVIARVLHVDPLSRRTQIRSVHSSCIFTCVV